jgi:predicted Zn finger-like uncharacterized protein
MIIQCEQCRTKFKLNDEKVSDRGVKVRCAKCRHVFTVRKDVAPAETAAAAFNSQEDTVRVSDPATPVQGVVAATPEPTVTFDFGTAPVQAAEVPDSSFDLGQTDATADGGFDFGDVAFGDAAPAAASLSDVDFGEMTMVMPPKKVSEPAPDFSLDFGTALVQPAAPASDAVFDFGDAITSSTDATAQKVEFDFGDDQQTSSVPPTDDVDLGSFDFGDATGTAAVPAQDIDSTDFSDFAAAVSHKTSSGNQDFSFDEPPPPSAASQNDSFDFSGVDFGLTTPVTAASTVPEADAFSLGEMDFSGDTSAVMVATSEPAAAGSLFAPVEEPSAHHDATAAIPDITFEAPSPAEEAPPLPLTSRRRQSSTISLVVGVIAVLVVGALGYLAVSMLGKAPVPVDEGKITVQNVKAYFVPKAAAGELLVITGEALNNHKKARAALQVKGMVYGANNQTLANKTAYAGNPLSQEQLSSMTAEKIDAAMNNQFGDSLVNLEVQPGKTIPFTVVIINPPKDGKDFGVEPVGSTIAASK